MLSKQLMVSHNLYYNVLVYTKNSLKTLREVNGAINPVMVHQMH